MSTTPRRGRRQRRARGAAVPASTARPHAWSPPDIPGLHPATLTLALLLGACVVALVTLRIQNTDLWTLLAQGRSLWDGLSPTINQWTWPTFGEPQVAASWAFRGLIWPLWDAAGITGIFMWKWLSALGVFTLVLLTGRRLGARGALLFGVLAVCAVIYRDRSDARPETLAALLLAATILVLETWRSRGRDLTVLLIPLALVWANAHVSYYLLFAFGLFYVIDAHIHGGKMGRPRAGRLWAMLGLALAVSFVNPSGWRALWQPFEFAMFWRADPMFAAIEELQPFSWTAGWDKGLPLLILAWPLALLWRAMAKRHLDVAELLACGAMTALAMTSLRFSAVYVIAAGPFIARDLGDALSSAGVPHPGPARDALVSPWVRAGLAAVFIAGFVSYHVAQAEGVRGVGIDMNLVPQGAADFMDRHGIRGRGFNHMQHGGYLSHRFWPDSSRAPFVTTQPELSLAATRSNYLEALRRPGVWLQLDNNLHFDYIVLERHQDPGDRLLDVIGADTTWTMVFADDAAELFVRRRGLFADIARESGYQWVPAGREGRLQMMQAVEQDSLLRVAVGAEVQRMADASPLNGHAHRLLGYFALMDDRFADAERHFLETLRLQPGIARIRELLGFLSTLR